MNSVMFQLQRSPWLWPRRMQICLWGCLCVLSFIASYFWLGESELAERLHATQMQYTQDVQSIQVLQEKLSATQQDLTRMAKTFEQKRDDTLSNVMQHLKASALALGLQLSVLVAPQTKDVPHLSFEVRGRYGDVWTWWQQAQTKSSSLVLQQVSLQTEGDQLQLTGRWLWSPIGLSASDEKSQAGTKVPNQVQSLLTVPANKPHRGASHHIGFDQMAWLQTQRWHVQQLPSYAKWVMPEVNRQPHHLEQFELRHLRYEGMISSANKKQALVRILDGSTTSYPLALIEPGAYLGQDFGRLQSITSEHLWLREVVRDVRGEWAPRWVKLPLGRLLEQAPSSKSAS